MTRLAASTSFSRPVSSLLPRRSSQILLATGSDDDADAAQNYMEEFAVDQARYLSRILAANAKHIEEKRVATEVCTISPWHR